MTELKICKHYVQGKCKKSDKCDYEHIDNICRFHFFGTCKHGDSCTHSHAHKLNGQNVKSNPTGQLNSKHKKKLVKKNTESFEPFDSSADMRIMIGNPLDSTYAHDYHSRDIILVHELFNTLDYSNGNLYGKLLEEVNLFGDQLKNQDIWKMWHGDTHYIADDHKHFKDKCPTFLMVVDKLKEYFKCDVKATRFNWYSDDSQFKPLHFDAAAVDPAKAKTQNITIGVSFGGTRDVMFENAKTRTKVNIPLSNGSIYCFLRDANIEWRHGIPQVSKDKQTGTGRISIILWGSVDIVEQDIL
jgi:hypothetical protein